MRKQFVTYEIAKKLKELGFNEPVLAFGNPTIENDFIPARLDNNVDKDNWFISIPLWQQVIDWLREKHNLHISITRDGGWWAFCSHDLSDEENSSPESKHNTKLLLSGGGKISDFYEQREKAILSVLSNLRGE